MAKRAKFNIPKITKSLKLREYSDAFPEDAEIIVWVNINKNVRDEYLALVDRVLSKRAESKESEKERTVADAVHEIDKDLFNWFRHVWSQGEDEESHWRFDEVSEFFESTQDTDPGLWPWVTAETLRLISDHRLQKKRK